MCLLVEGSTGFYHICLQKQAHQIREKIIDIYKKCLNFKLKFKFKVCIGVMFHMHHVFFEKKEYLLLNLDIILEGFSFSKILQMPCTVVL